MQFRDESGATFDAVVVDVSATEVTAQLEQPGPASAGKLLVPCRAAAVDLSVAAETLVRWRRRAIPFVAQAEMADCGAAALVMALAYHGRHVPLAEMHAATGTGRDGTDALRLAEAATTYGLRARGVATELDDLRVLPEAPYCIGAKRISWCWSQRRGAG